MKTKFVKYFFAALAMYAVLLLAACPKESAISHAAKASYRLPGATLDLENAIESGHDQGIISADLTRKFGAALEPAAKAEKSLVVLVRAANQVYKQTGSIPAAQMSEITQTIDLIIVAVSSVTQIFNLLPANAQAILNVALTAVRLLLQTIGSGFGSTLVHLIALAPNGPSPAGLVSPKMRFA